MIKAYILSGVILLAALGLRGQTYVVQGTIEHAEKGQVYLAVFQNDRFRMVDSMMTLSGLFYFLLDESSDPGLYRVIFSDRVNGVRSDQRFFEFIFNRENVEVYVASGERGPIPYFDHTVENQVYMLFQDYELAYEAQVMLIYGHLPELRAVRDYDSIQVARHQFMDSLSALYPDLYATRMMKAFRSPLIPGSMTHAERIDTLKTCFFDHASLDDPLLLNAPVYPFKIIDYLSLFKVDTLSAEEQEKQFCLAVDGIMAHVSADPSLRSFVVDFLLEGFEMLDMERVQLHIADNYLDEACESDVAGLVAWGGMGRLLPIIISMPLPRCFCWTGSGAFSHDPLPSGSSLGRLRSWRINPVRRSEILNSVPTVRDPYSCDFLIKRPLLSCQVSSQSSLSFWVG